MNINRDYLIILDVKSGEVDSPNIYYFNTDKNTSNLYVQMVIHETIVEATPIENASDYSIKANILKPNMVAKEVEGTLVNPEKAIYEFVLPADCTDFSGNAKIEFEVFCTVNGIEEVATSFSTKFKVYGSILTDQNKYIEDSSDYPILKQLIEEVRELQTNGGGGTGSGHTHSNKDVLDGITATKVNHWDTAYTHSQTAHFSGDYNDLTNKPTIPTNTSDLTNNSGFATETYVTNAIANAQLGGGGTVDLSGYVTKETGNASQITFSDGQTFQAKLDAGTLKGDKGDTGKQGPQGEQGEQGPQGPAGTDGLTTSIVLNGVTYTQQNGVITLPNISGGGEVVPVEQVEPEELDMPKVFFYGDALPTTKDNVNLTMDYISNTDKFTSYVKLKCQGNSSMSYAKKNFTINMYSDEARTTKLKKDFKGWGNQSKFCLKANYVDTTHTRNISGARIGYDMIASRPDSAFKQQLLTAPRYGLVDGFPIKLYFNGEFYGIYTWNIPKDTWMFNMDDSNPNHVVLCAERNTDGNSSLINSCQFRKLWDGSDGGDWSYEVGTPSNTVKDSLNRCIGFVMNSTDQEFHDNISEYFDLYSLLDYYCFSYLTCHLDGLAKNMLMVTYDGVIWGASLYDMDSIYGVSWNGGSFVATNYKCPEQYQEQFSLLWKRIEECFGVELYARYLELRQGALSLSNIIKHVEEIYDVIPDRVFKDEQSKWTSLPQVSSNTITRFRNYMRDRAVYVDAQMLEIGTKVACTSITLSANNLSFTTTDTQTLTATVQPSNTTDVVTWSVSPAGIVTVDNGLVTAKANGSAVITATCGTQSATCTVTVSGVNSGGGADVSQLSNVISYYDASTLNPGDTTWTDSVNGHTLTINNGATVGDGVLSFDGVDDYAEGSLDLSSYTTLTLALDIRNSVRTGRNIETFATIGHVNDSSGAVPIIKYKKNNNGYLTGVNDSSILKTIVPTDFDRAIVVRDRTTIKLYINGELIVNTTFKPFVDNYRLLVGANYYVNSYCDFSNFSTSKIIVMGSAATDDEIAIIDNMLSQVKPDKPDMPTNNTAIFRVDATCLNTETNTLTDSVAGISATLTGTPTQSDNNIVFTTSDTFRFDISSLNLNNKDITIRIKFTPTTLDTTIRNVFTLGDDTWSNSYTNYISNAYTRIQFGTNAATTGSNIISDATVNNFTRANGVNVGARTINIESELILSVKATTKAIRVFLDGTLIQDGILGNIKTLTVLSNTEGSGRFIGSYSLIEIYNAYCDTYEVFTSMVNA